MKKTLLAFLTALILVVFAMGAVPYAYSAYQEAQKPTYDTTTAGCTYYMYKDIPGCFEHYFGYEPQISLNEKEKVATVYCREGKYITIPMKLFAPDMWALEVPEGTENLFKKWEFNSYKCYSLEWDNKFFAETGAGIFYDYPTLCEFFKEQTGSDAKISEPAANTNGNWYISVGDSTYVLKNRRTDYGYAENGDFLISAKIMSQLVYDWEMNHMNYEPMHIGDIFMEW